MHVEVGFRDLQSTCYGFGFETSLTCNPERLAILLLIAALALLACWLIGLAMARGQHYRLQVNSLCHRPLLSVFTIGWLIAQSEPYYILK